MNDPNQAVRRLKMPRSSPALKVGRRHGLPGPGGPFCYRHRWLTLLTWIAGVACLITLWMQFGASADNTFTGSDPGQVLLNQHFPRASGDTLTLAIRSSASITSTAVRDRVTGALVPFERAAHVTSVSNPYRRAGQISRDGHIAFATVQFDQPSASIATSEASALISDARAASGQGITFSLGGDLVDLAETPYGGPTAAAAIMVVVFLTVVLGANVSVKQIGLGLAVAVLIDATLVRMVLVPAVMELLGKANWWLPGPLDRILPKAPLSQDEPPAIARKPVPTT